MTTSQHLNPTSRTDGYDKPSARYYALSIFTLAYAVNFIDRQLVSILQESIKSDLALSDTQLGALSGFAFALLYVIMGIPIAYLADRISRRNILTICISIWSVMTAFCGMAASFWQLFLARMGVGIGEAGCSPPIHSMIADIYPRQQRATALSIYSTGINIGILFGLLLGGFLNEYFGWRVAFLVVGLPGVLVAIVIQFTIKEPIRGVNETAVAKPIGIKQALEVLVGSKAFCYLALAAALQAFIGYGVTSWFAPYIIRSFAMGTAELGIYLGVFIGVFGGIGTYFGGYVADKLSQKDMRWYMWLPAINALIPLPFSFFIYQADTAYQALYWFAIPAMVATVYLGPVLAMTQALAGIQMRAFASAILFFVINLIGLGLGPTSIGILSDWLAPDYGIDSLRYSMLGVILVFSALSAFIFYLASRSLVSDLDRVQNL